jgi:hypothetical protein
MATNLKTLTVKQLRGAKYNPRTITDSKLRKLGESIQTFGDLSGVVYNVKTGVLVSGHQRLKTIKGLQSKIEILHQHSPDVYGTVGNGQIVVKTENGLIKIPFRAVAWDVKMEKAANVAANAHGGDFDKDKLALVIADLENVAGFDIEMTGLDPLTIKQLKVHSRSMDAEAGDTDSGSDDGEIGDDEFQEITKDGIKTDHVCPRCSFRF